jgi:hypothetical protein
VVSPRELAQAQQMTVTRVVPAAEVLHVNPGYRYVILECTVLPREGEEAKVYRGDRVTAELKVSGYRRGPFVAADIVSGEPQRGDPVRLERIVTVPVTEEVLQ